MILCNPLNLSSKITYNTLGKYAVKEIFYTIQGEGFHTGRAAVFCRFAGCNLWSGQEKDRMSAVCRFCDTDFKDTKGINGGKYDAPALAEVINKLWPADITHKFVVLTGGEPMLQVDAELITALHERGFFIALETNGTIAVPETIDWICVSPKADADLAQLFGNELKLVFPQIENQPEDYTHLHFTHFFLQPLDDENQSENVAATIEYIRKNPQWRISLQTHKIMNIP